MLILIALATLFLLLAFAIIPLCIALAARCLARCLTGRRD